MVLELLLKLVHVVAGVTLLVNFVGIAALKVASDRSGDPKARAFAHDLVHRLDRRVTAWAGVATFAAGYPIIRVLGFWGGSIAGAPWALWALILMTVGGLVWYFLLLPLEVKMADAAERAAAGAPLPVDYARWSGTWTVAVLALAALVLGISGLMVFKPGA